MKDWRTATAAGLCAFDQAHSWRDGDRVFAVTVAGVQRVKLYCAGCAVARHGAPPDPGESAAQPPAKVAREPWTPVGMLAAGFDAKLVAAEGRERE